MGYIKEPKGVDFIIQSKPLTDEERKVISKFIQDYKAKPADKSCKKIKNYFIKTKIISPLLVLTFSLTNLPLFN